MPRKQSKIGNRKPSIGSSDAFSLAALTFAVSLVALSYYFQKSQILLYGDAIAHINIARRVFDSRTPGLLQLGTVWLPLPHLLMIPFLLSKEMWQTGIGGSIVSMLAYVLGAVGIFRLTRGLLEIDPDLQPRARAAGWIAALLYAGNPNLIYLQTTAMTESLYLAFFVWSVVFLAKFVQTETIGLTTGNTEDHGGKPWKCALCIAAAELTRYDGWFLAFCIGLAVAAFAATRWSDRQLRWRAARFLIAIVIPPLLWMAYNAAVYGNALEFANGPYSARAIDQRAATAAMPAHPGSGNPIVSTQYFLKSAQLNMAPGNWGRVWLVVAALGLLLMLVQFRKWWPALILLSPALFYAISIAYAGAPLFVPTWWPFSSYNLRYGLQILPLFAVSAALVGIAGIKSISKSVVNPLFRRVLATSLPAAILLTAFLSYFFTWRAQPPVFTEAYINSHTKRALESAVGRFIQQLPHDSNYLMYLGDHVGAFQEAGIPLRQVINEGNHRPWKSPTDPEGLWERALAHPAQYVNFVIAFEGDPVARTANKTGLDLLTIIHTSGQPEARVYATKSFANQSR